MSSLMSLPAATVRGGGPWWAPFSVWVCGRSGWAPVSDRRCSGGAPVLPSFSPSPFFFSGFSVSFSAAALWPGPPWFWLRSGALRARWGVEGARRRGRCAQGGPPRGRCCTIITLSRFGTCMSRNCHMFGGIAILGASFGVCLTSGVESVLWRGGREGSPRSEVSEQPC